MHQAPKTPIGAILVFRGPRTNRVAGSWRVVGRSGSQIRVEILEDHTNSRLVGTRMLVSRTISAEIFAGRTEFLAGVPGWAEDRLPA